MASSSLSPLPPMMIGPGTSMSQHAMMSAAMLDAKKARMKAEHDREALANRINRLQMEEIRATKRIEQTHRRTQEIVDAKDRHHEHTQQKEQKRQEQDALVDEHRQYLKSVKDQSKQNLLSAKTRVAVERQQISIANKESAARNSDAIEGTRRSELELAMFKRNEVRRVEADARERKLREKELMIAHMQQRAADRAGAEEQSCTQLQRTLDTLEREEYELLLSLEAHKNERLAVYGELESQAGKDISGQLAGPLRSDLT